MPPEDSNPTAVPAQVVPNELIVHEGGRTHRVKYQRGDTLLEAMRQGGIPAPSLCEQGVCGSCMVRLRQGEVTLRENHVLADEDLAAGYTLACQGEATGSVCELEIPS
jgi:3-ketosteroid 9alpha-monooxygenase subunit B